MVNYESHSMDGNGVLRENPPWFISKILTRCLPGCDRHESLVATGAPGGVKAIDPDTGRPFTAERRLEIARATACTCGKDAK